MRARFGDKSLVVALFAGTVLILAFSVLHRVGTSTPGIGNAEVPRSVAVERFQPFPKAGMAAATSGAAVGVADEANVAVSQPQLHLVPPPPRGSRGPSQLIRTANISLEVTNVSKALQAATTITDEQLGDVIGLSDESPTSESQSHTATMSIRVPQYRFDQTLEALGTLGKVTSKSVNAQDVSDQIVDAQARLRNLRRTEQDMLGIMDRSGNIDQVLNVTQQISSVREQIERLDAQIQGLQYQVAYSTINISVISPVVATTPTGFAVLGAAWKSALDSLRDFTVSLLSLGLWIIAFSPYLLVVALFVGLVLRRVHALMSASPKTST